jgi:hypothetical protein
MVRDRNSVRVTDVPPISNGSVIISSAVVVIHSVTKGSRVTVGVAVGAAVGSAVGAAVVTVGVPVGAAVSSRHRASVPGVPTSPAGQLHAEL